MVRIHRRIHRLRAIRQLVGQTGLAVVVLFGLNQQVLAQAVAPKVSEQTEAHPEPMDEDWQTISNRALLDQLTYMATEIENQRERNAALESKVDMLTQRLDGIQALLVGNGTILMPPLPIEQTTLPKNDSAAQHKSVLPPLDLTHGTPDNQASIEDAPSGVSPAPEAQEETGYMKKILDAGGSVVKRVTDW
ncbi:hypothetical protein [Cohaesibacter celericrescens]|uniref:Uncharacterized protein n=1 Tax=Cohaesibacter celericrescens TaxID=2067669 RepID=A0A2N5XM68_9HYPH|nr:hypothetical protein [Cohaesibacter celericrescens]PLW75583.1 hypothetical protein C0081_18185 [Cohaesibacter celericrescens]